MPDKDTDAPAIAVDLPAVYSQGGFVQVRTIILQSEPANMPNSIIANDSEPPADILPAS
jgi:hypothetical protein